MLQPTLLLRNVSNFDTVAFTNFCRYEYKWEMEKSTVVKLAHKGPYGMFGTPIIFAVKSKITGYFYVIILIIFLSVGIELYDVIVNQLARFISKDRLKSKYPFTIQY